MCTAEYNIKVVEGNEFLLVLPLKKRTYVASVPIDEDIDATALIGCVVKIGDVEYTPTLDEDGVKVLVPATLARGTYDIIVTATYHGSAIRAAYFDALTIVAWNEQSNAQQYIQGSPVVAQAAYVIGGTLTDAELESLKAEYRLKIAAAEEAKEAADAAKQAYDTKAEALDDIAQQSTLTQGVSDIREDISHIDIDTSTLAKQGNNESATLTATQTAATNAYASAEAAKTAAQAITGYATEANATANKNAILDKIGTPASGQPTDLFAAIAAGGGGGGDQTAIDLFADKFRSIGLPVPQNASLYDLFQVVDQYAMLTLGGTRFLPTEHYVSLGDAIWAYNNRAVVEAYSELATSFSWSIVNYSGSILKKIYLPNVTSIEQADVMASVLEYVDLSKWDGVARSDYYIFRGATKLIYLKTGENMNKDLYFSGWQYNPTEAMSTSSQSLVEPGETFASNNEKWNYNLRTYFAANLADRTGLAPYTISFGQTVLGNMDSDTISAFTSKNWTLA